MTPAITRAAASKTFSLRCWTVAVFVVASAAQAQHKSGGPAQSIALSASLPSYDVVSIKQNKTGDGSFKMGTSDSNDRFSATNVPLKSIVQFAYDIKEDLITGISGPVSSVNFDIEAKAIGPDGGPPPKLSDTQLQAMLIQLLADRFQLKAHLQTKVLPVYDLIVIRGGPKFQLSQAERKDSSWNWSWANHDITIVLKGASMTELAAGVSDAVHRTVFDKTGLKGGADLTLKWTDDAADASAGPVLSIFTAVEEQLGLKLQPSKGPVDTLVVDHVEMPSEN